MPQTFSTLEQKAVTYRQIISTQQDEIKRLRAALMEICDMCPATADYTVAYEMAQIAGDVLNGESVDSGKQGQKDE